MDNNKVTQIETTFTYDSETDQIGWLHMSSHRSIKPKIHTNKRYNYQYCLGRGGRQFKVEDIKNVLGGMNEQYSQRCL